MMIDEKWIIDVHPGCDDLFAILYFVKFLKDNLELISLTQGNCTITDVTRNIKRILRLANCNPLVMVGNSNALLKGFEYSYGHHKADGLGNIKILQELDIDNNIIITEGSSVLKIVELCKIYSKKINILCIGPLTNLALACMIDPSIVTDVNRLVIMGGTTHSKGNETRCAEANFGFDPLAAKVVLSNFNNMEIVPLESTELVSISKDDFQRIRDNLGSEYKVNETVFEALYELLKVFNSGLIICDFYAAICCFNNKVIKKNSYL